MKTFLRMIGLVFSVTLLTAAPTVAGPITYVSFTDTHKYWLQGSGSAVDWHNNSTTGGYVDDNLDVIGTPNFLGGTVGFTSGGGIASIKVDYTNGSSVEKIGDLFLDINSDNVWDYVVKLYDNNTNSSGAAGAYNLYSVSINAAKNAGYDAATHTDPRYLLSGQDQSGIWSGYIIRDDSPFAAQSRSLGAVVGQVNFSGWSASGGINASTFTFDANSLPSLSGGSLLTLAWEPNCANDVLWEQLQAPPSAVPEPGSFVLLGSGLVGFIGFRRLSCKQAKDRNGNA